MVLGGPEQTILVFMTVLAAITVTTFAVYYMTVRWEESPAGKSIMAASWSNALLAWCAVAQRYDEVRPDVDWKDEIRPGLILAWTVVFCVFAWRINELRKSKKNDHD